MKKHERSEQDVSLKDSSSKPMSARIAAKLRADYDRVIAQRDELRLELEQAHQARDNYREAWNAELKRREVAEANEKAVVAGAMKDAELSQREFEAALAERDEHRARLAYAYRLACTGRDRALAAEPKMLFDIIANELAPKNNPAWWALSIGALSMGMAAVYAGLAARKNP